jgi:SAM-dependent methyltransferase
VREGVRREAAIGFDRAARTYERGRAGFPPAAVEAILREAAAGPGRTLLELGAGTGKLTRALVGSGARVVALEPVAGMRAVLAEVVPEAEIVDAVAEDVPLPAASADAVVAAQAFHWFDPERATAEIARVLRPGGLVALLWNRRDERVPWVAALSRLLDAHSAEVPRYQHGHWRRAFDAGDRFEPLTVRAWPNSGEAGRDVVLARVASISFVAVLDERRRAELLGEVERILDADPETRGRDDVALPYVTELFTTRLRA